MEVYRIKAPQESWNELYEAAIVELNPVKLRVRVDAARKAIHARLEQLNGTLADNPAEKRRLEDALHMLDTVLKIETMSSDKSASENPAA